MPEITIKITRQMIRNIVFRGKRKIDGEWVYGDLEYNRKRDIARIHSYDGNGNYECQAVVMSNSIGQYTGVIDNNGTQIFEGDIVAYKDKPFGIVIWHSNGYFCINDSFDMEERDYSPIGQFFKWCYIRENKNTFSVIGNIHDNPELINQPKTNEK